jgi:hypothetical protein
VGRREYQRRREYHTPALEAGADLKAQFSAQRAVLRQLFPGTTLISLFSAILYVLFILLWS